MTWVECFADNGVAIEYETHAQQLQREKNEVRLGSSPVKVPNYPKLSCGLLKSLNQDEIFQFVLDTHGMTQYHRDDPERKYPLNRLLIKDVEKIDVIDAEKMTRRVQKVRNKVNDVFLYWTDKLKEHVLLSNPHLNDTGVNIFERMEQNLRVLTWEDKLAILLRRDVGDEEVAAQVFEGKAGIGEDLEGEERKIKQYNDGAAFSGENIGISTVYGGFTGEYKSRRTRQMDQLNKLARKAAAAAERAQELPGSERKNVVANLLQNTEGNRVPTSSFFSGHHATHSLNFATSLDNHFSSKVDLTAGDLSNNNAIVDENV